MKSSAGILAAAALALACFASRGQEAPLDEAPLIRAEGVTIDGALSEPFWAQAAAVRGDYVNSGKGGVLSEEPRLTVKYAWDDQYLYIGYETFDKNLIAKASGVKEGPEKNKRDGCEIWSPDPKEKVDVVEFFISFGDERFFWELHHNAANQFNDVWCTVVDPAWPIAKSALSTFGILFNNREYIADDNDFTTSFAVKLKPRADGSLSTLNASDDTDTGYTAELRLPWGGLGAPAAARPDAKKKETGWKVDGQKMMILAVVQDGDLKERYHHSAPKRKGDWFHKTAALWPRYVLSKGAPQEKKPALFNLETASPTELANEIIRRIDKHEHVAELIQPAVDGGMAVARACAPGLSLDRPERLETLYNIIAMAARSRRSHRELLKLYDPVAYEIFYTAAGNDVQKQFALALKTESWSPKVTEALINAAPLPVLAFLNAQAASDSPDLRKAGLLLKQWCMNIYFRRECQYLDEVRSAIAALSTNKKLLSDAASLEALIRFAGESEAVSLAPFVAKALSHAEAAVRAEACQALKQFGGEKAPAELLALAENETEKKVLLALAEALGAWHDDGESGGAALAVFKRCKDAEVRRALLFSCSNAEWPQRTALLLEAFQDPEAHENGVLGVALQGVAAHPEDVLKEKTLSLISAFPNAPAPLIEALGTVNDSKAASYLIDALKKSKNLSIRLKICLALEQIGGAEAHATLLAELKSTTDSLLAQQLVAIAGRVKLPGAEEILISLAGDSTAPLPVRIQCLWSLGAYQSSAVLAALKRMDAQADTLFTTQDGSDSSVFEKNEQARMLLKMALLQQGDSTAANEAAALFASAVPATRISMLMLLASLKRDHAVIKDSLRSSDFAVMLAAVHAARAADPAKYHGSLVALQESHFVKALLQTGLDLNDLGEVLEHAIAAGKQTP